MIKCPKQLKISAKLNSKQKNKKEKMAMIQTQTPIVQRIKWFKMRTLSNNINNNE